MMSSGWLERRGSLAAQYSAAIVARENRLLSAHQQGNLAHLRCPLAIFRSKKDSAECWATAC
jgi:hypothetical protein